MEYLDGGRPVVSSPNVDKEITILTINISLYSYIGNIKNREL